MSKGAYARDREDKIGAVLVSLAELLLAQGDTSAALDTLQKTLDGGWDVSRFRRVAGLFWRTRDTTAAAQAYAFVSADPATPRSERDSLAGVFSRSIGADRWDRLASAARDQIRQRVLQDALSRRLSKDVRLSTDSAGTVTLSALTAGRVSVLVFWSRFCGPSRAQLPSYGQLQSQLQAIGAQFIPVAVEQPSRDVREFLRDAHTQFATWYDPHGALRVAVNNIATPTYYVLDQTGRIRFVGHLSSLALTQASALRGE
jgi:thiol-disulfide isomerase/thioredoxin